MQIKDGVNIWGLERVMQPVLKAAEEIWKHHGQELVVTSARDGIHSAESLHYYGQAVDLRTRYFSEGVVVVIATKLRKTLGKDYDVVVHKTHIHVEYDPKWGG